jgi:hypothetical protein
LNKKICALLILTVSIVFAAPFVNAQTVFPRVSTWTDKPRYGPGERGTLYIVFYNDRAEAIEVRNITLVYTNWHAYINQAWVGNETKKYSVTIASKAKNVFSDVTFTTPSDGRAVYTPVSIEIGTDHGYEPAEAYIYFFESSRYMDQIVMLFTVLVVLVIVCTVIIAAAVFLSARRPQVMWSKEDKPQ